MRRGLFALALTFLIGVSASAQMCGGGNCVAPTPPNADNSNRIATTAFVLANGSATAALPTNQIFIGNGSNVATATAMSGDCTIVFAAGAITCTKSNGVAFGSAAFLNITPAALTKADDTNVTLTLAGTPGTALLQATSITAGWTGTLAAARLNGNVVQSIVNDTNVTGSISAQALTLGWAGTLGLARGGCGAALTASNGGILYSTASACAVLAGTATANLPLLSNASAAPSWATVSHPTSAVSGGVPFFSSTTVMGSSALLTANAIMLGGGAGVAPSTLASLGTTTTVLHGNAAGVPSFGAVSMTADVTGTLPVANGGTGVASATAYALLTGGTTTTAPVQSVAGVGSAGQCLISNGPGALPTWGTCVAGGSVARTRQTLLTGTAATYTRPTSPTPLYLVVRMVGGGGGGAGSGTTPGAAGAGGNTLFSSFIASGGGGSSGVFGAPGGALNAAGSPSTNLAGGAGASVSSANTSFPGGIGGASVFGGSGRGGPDGQPGAAATANTGGGGGGAGNNATVSAGGGGGAGAYIETIVTSPAATYTYTVGAGGAGGTAGTSGFAGGAGGTGIIIVDEFYQ